MKGTASSPNCMGTTITRLGGDCKANPAFTNRDTGVHENILKPPAWVGEHNVTLG